MDNNYRDKNNNVPDLSLIGRTFQHVDNRKVYKITRPVFICDSDQWGYEHIECGVEEPVTMVRSIKNFFGLHVSQNKPRFKEVTEPCNTCEE